MGFLILAFLAALGFVASVTCHVLGWLHVDPPGGQWVFMLHVGWLALWFPLVIFANRTMPKGAKSNIDHLFAVSPKWVGRAVTGLFIYAILNFIYFFYSGSQYPKNGVPSYVELRGFSGHWMLFYGAAVAGFVALARVQRMRKEEGDGK